MTQTLDTSGEQLDIKIRRGTDVVVEIACTDPTDDSPADFTGVTADASATASGQSTVTLDVDITTNVVTLTIARATIATMTGNEWSYGIFTTSTGLRTALVSGRLILRSEFG
jgi:hypothetical protein